MGKDLVDLEGRVGLVTGAGQGVGRQIALHFGAHGAGAVVVNDFHLARAEAVAKEVEALGCRALAVAADVTDRTAVDAMVARAKAELGGVDVLVNNAGNMGADPRRVERKPFWDASPASWDAFIGVNLYGVLHCTSAVIPGMIEKSAGRLITVISDAGRVGEPGLEIYSAAKAGANALAHSAQLEVRGSGIQVCVFCPGMVATPMSEWMIEAGVPQEEMVQPEDLGEALRFLLRTSRNCLVPEIEFLPPRQPAFVEKILTWQGIAGTSR